MAEVYVYIIRVFSKQTIFTIYPDFEVVEPLPNISFPINRNWAGNIRVNRAGHPNDTLFFWGFEREEGSLTEAAYERIDQPWAIWLNGG